MFVPLTALAYRDSGQFEQIGPVPALPLLLLDPGQVVDTLAFNDLLDVLALRQLGRTTQIALQYLKEGVINSDPQAIGAAATLSAEQYQSISFNPLLEKTKQWAKETGAVGVVRAHSGSVFGLLYQTDTDLASPTHWLQSRFTGNIVQTHLVSGGAQIMNNNQLITNYYLPISQSPNLSISPLPETLL